jgi:FAD-dependent oxidoreductase family protein
MNRRNFSKSLIAAAGVVKSLGGAQGGQPAAFPNTYREPARELSTRKYDVVVAGGGTAGVVAALAAARQGARTMLVEAKGYPGGTVVEGGTALHSYFNLWKAFPGVKKRQVVKGIPSEIVDRMARLNATTGHAEMTAGYDYDAVCTAIDTELYKLVAFEMLEEAGVFVAVNTLLTDAIMDGSKIRGVITESRSGREAIWANSFVDSTAYGDLCHHAGADYSEPNDYSVCNSIGLGNASIEKLTEFLEENDAIQQFAKGMRSGMPDEVVRVKGVAVKMPEAFYQGAKNIGMTMTTTTTHENYFMFIKFNFKMGVSPTSRDAVSKAELELRRRQYRGVELFKRFIPGFEKAFIARTSPSLNIRRGRLITCDYDITHEDVIEARHFDDDIMAYGFHDMAPRLQIKNGGTFGVPYRALRVKGIDNLLASGMMITADHRAHMSTRNTVCSMGQGQAAGTAAALCSKSGCGTRELKYADLRGALEKADVYFEG